MMMNTEEYFQATSNSNWTSMGMMKSMSTINPTMFDDFPSTSLSELISISMPSAPAVPQPTAKKPTVKKASAAETKHFLKANKNKTTVPPRTRRRVIPTHKDYIPEQEPTPFDVVSGRGGRSNHHAGNRHYWMQVLGFRQAYKVCDIDVKKAEIAQAIVDSIHVLPGRFLQTDESKRWFVVPDRVALDKVKQALRDKYVPFWAKNIRVEPRTLESTMQATTTTTAPSATVPKKQTTTIAAATETPNNIVSNNDDLTDAIDTLPSFKIPVSFWGPNSLDWNRLHSLSEKSLDCFIQNPSLRCGTTLDGILDRLHCPPSSLGGGSGTDWNRMYTDAFEKL
jgi:hypothetical protein